MESGIPQGSPVSPILFTVYLSGLFGYVEERVTGVKALSFVDDVAWTTEGDTVDDISPTLKQAAAAAQEWAEANAIAFDTEKTEAILLSRRRKRKTPAPPRGIQVAGHGPVQCAGHPMARHLARLPAHLERTPRGPDEGQERPEPASETRWTSRLLPRELPTGPVRVRPSGRPLWLGTGWKGDGVHGMVGRPENVQELVNQEARLTTGTFRTTNQEALSLESGFRPAVAQLETVCDASPSGSPASQAATRPGNSLGPRTASSVRDCSPPSDAGTAERTRSPSRWPPPWRHPPRSRRRQQ